jgi:hypothetical protein
MPHVGGHLDSCQLQSGVQEELREHTHDHLSRSFLGATSRFEGVAKDVHLPYPCDPLLFITYDRSKLFPSCESRAKDRVDEEAGLFSAGAPKTLFFPSFFSLAAAFRLLLAPVVTVSK